MFACSAKLRPCSASDPVPAERHRRDRASDGWSVRWSAAVARRESARAAAVPRRGLSGWRHLSSPSSLLLCFSALFVIQPSIQVMLYTYGSL